MTAHRPGFTARRRRSLALKVAEIDRMESRSTVTPVGLAAFALGAAPSAAQVGLLHANGAGGII